ncbi:MAG: DUF6464 family protein [Cyanobacteria bacterium P01_A01_bin.84]
MKILLVISIGFLPSLFSLWVIRKKQWQRRARMRHITSRFTRERIWQNNRLSDNYHPADNSQENRYYLEGVGYLIGDISCKYNARSGYLRCAVNPEGPCDRCRFYEAIPASNCNSSN